MGSFYLPMCSPISRKVRAETQVSNIEVSTEADAIKECCLLAFYQSVQCGTAHNGLRSSTLIVSQGNTIDFLGGQSYTVIFSIKILSSKTTALCIKLA